MFSSETKTWIPQPTLSDKQLFDTQINKILEPIVSINSIDLGITRVQGALFTLVQARALHGMQDKDADHVLAVAKEVVEDALTIARGGQLSGRGELRKGNETRNQQQLARTFFWFALAQYYGDDTEGALKSFVDSNAQNVLPAPESRLLQGWIERAERFGPAREASAYGGSDVPTLAEAQEIYKLRIRAMADERRHARQLQAWKTRQDEKREKKKARAQARIQKQSKTKKEGQQISAAAERESDETETLHETKKNSGTIPDPTEPSGSSSSKWFSSLKTLQALFDTNSQLEGRSAATASNAGSSAITNQNTVDTNAIIANQTIAELSAQIARHTASLTDLVKQLQTTTERSKAQANVVQSYKHTIDNLEADNQLLKDFPRSHAKEDNRSAVHTIAELQAKISELNIQLQLKYDEQEKKDVEEGEVDLKLLNEDIDQSPSGMPGYYTKEELKEFKARDRETAQSDDPNDPSDSSDCDDWQPDLDSEFGRRLRQQRVLSGDLSDDEPIPSAEELFGKYGWGVDVDVEVGGDKWLHGQRILDKVRRQLEAVPAKKAQKKAQEKMHQTMRDGAERLAKEEKTDKWNRIMGEFAQDAYIRDQEFYKRPIHAHEIQRIGQRASQRWETFQELWWDVADEEGWDWRGEK